MPFCDSVIHSKWFTHVWHLRAPMICVILSIWTTATLPCLPRDQHVACKESQPIPTWQNYKTSPVQHPSTSVMQLSNTFSRHCDKGSNNQCPIAIMSNPGPLYHTVGKVQATSLVFRSLRNMLCTETEMRHCVHHLLHWAGKRPAICTVISSTEDFFLVAL